MEVVEDACVKHGCDRMEAQGLGELLLADLLRHGLPRWLVLEKYQPGYAANNIDISQMSGKGDIKAVAESEPPLPWGVTTSVHEGTPKHLSSPTRTVWLCLLLEILKGGPDDKTHSGGGVCLLQPVSTSECAACLSVM